MQGKDKTLIMVVREKDLFGKNREDFFEGFRPSSRIDYETRILLNFGFMTRGFAEQDPKYKQPIAYTLIVNPNSKKVFAYQRALKDKHYDEERLQGKWSLGVGGHIEMKDLSSDEGNPIRASLERELEREEVEFVDGKILGLDVLGYIYLDNGVHAVHFGMLYLAKTNARTVNPKDPEIARGKLMSLQEIEQIKDSPECELEGWSETAFGPLEEYITGLYL